MVSVGPLRSVEQWTVLLDGHIAHMLVLQRSRMGSKRLAT